MQPIGKTHNDFEEFKDSQDQKVSEILHDVISNLIESPLIKIKQVGLKQYLKDFAPKVDIDELFLSQIKKHLSYSRAVNIGSGLGRANLQYRNNKIQINITGAASWFINEVTVTDEQIIEAIDDVIDQFQKKYIDDLSYLTDKFDQILRSLSKTDIYKPKTTEEKTLYDVLLLILLKKYKKKDVVPEWIKIAIEKFEREEVIKHLLISIVEHLSSIAENISENLYLNLKLTFDSKILRVTLNKMTNNGQLAGLFNMFGIDINEEIDSFVDEYMTPSFVSGIGEILIEIVNYLLYEDDNQEEDNECDKQSKPSQITMTLGEDPYTQRLFRWYTETAVKNSYIQISDSENFDNAITIQAVGKEILKPRTIFSLGLISMHKTKRERKYSVKVKDLTPGMSYWYRVGDIESGCFSDIYKFKIQNKDSKLKFLSLADSQGMVKSDYDTFTKVFMEATDRFKDIDFTVHLGDFVDDGNNEEYWHFLLDREVWGLNTIVPMAGNHEARVKKAILESGGENSILYHFNLENYPKQDTSTGVYYSFIYKDTTFIVLNANAIDETGKLTKEQYNWAIDTAKNSKSKWKIVLSHKSPYSNGPHYYDTDVREISGQILDICQKGRIDLLLGGHDHVYVRTPVIYNGVRQKFDVKLKEHDGITYQTAINPYGTLYIVPGTSGVKNYKQYSSVIIPTELMSESKLPIYSTIEIDNDTLYFTAYSYDENTGKSKLFDKYALEKTANCKMEKNSERLGCDNYDTSKLNIAKGIKVVSDRMQFLSAIKDPNVGTIITDGADIKFETFIGTKRNIVVNRDLIIRGSSRLIYACFCVKNSATLIIDDSVFIDNARRQNSLYPAINAAKVYDDSKFIFAGNSVMRTEYGLGKKAYCVELIGENSEAHFYSRSEQWGENGVVFSKSKTSSLYINAGKYRSKGKNYTIKSDGKVNIKDGMIKSVCVLENGVMNLSSGTIGKTASTATFIPLRIYGKVYMTGGSILGSRKKSIVLLGNGELSLLPIHQGAIEVLRQNPFIKLKLNEDLNQKIVEPEVVGINIVAQNMEYLYSSDKYIDNPVEAEYIKDIKSECLNKFYLNDDDKAIFAKIRVNRLMNGVVCKDDSNIYLFSEVKNLYK